jgi:hypothetical protein
MKKRYIRPTIQIVELPGKGILTIVVSGEDTYNTKYLNTDAIEGENPPSDDNTLTEGEFL